MKCLSILKPLNIKLQKRDINVFQAYNHNKDFKSDLLDIRGDIEKYARKADITPSMQRIVGRQQRQSNVETEKPKDYCKRALTVPL